MRRSDSVKQLLIDHLDRFPDLADDPYLAWAAVDLARAQLLTGEEDAAASLADRALGAVEKLDLTEAIADAMVTRGTALASTRYHQAMALLRGALAICTDHDLTDTKLRALINIGYASQELDETFAATEAAFEESKRIGDRNHASFVAGNLVGGLIFQFRLDDAENVLADPVWSPEPSDQVHREIALADVELRRGNREEAGIHMAAAQGLAGGVADAQALLAVERVEATFALVDGDSAAVYDVGVRHFEESPFAVGISVGLAVLGAALLGDPDKLERARAMTETLPPGAFTTAPRRWAEIMVDLVGGDVDPALANTEELLVWLRQRDMVWQEFLTLTTVSRVLPPDHDARARYVERIQEMTMEAGAHGLWDWARAAIGDTGG